MLQRVAMATRKKTARKKTAPKKAARKKKKTGKKPAASKPKRPAEPAPRMPWLAERFTELVEQTAASALRRAVDVGGRELGAWLPESSEMRREAGAYIRELRELTGLTLDELAEAIELSDHSLLGAVEAGTATLSFELILRLAAILARHDPAPFVSRMVRSYNPVLWEMLEAWGLGRLPIQRVREREFVNILRGSDEARALSDAEFARVLDFTRAAFELALGFADESEKG